MVVVDALQEKKSVKENVSISALLSATAAVAEEPVPKASFVTMGVVLPTVPMQHSPSASVGVSISKPIMKTVESVEKPVPRENSVLQEIVVVLPT